jgi:hypothetical protein
VERSAQRFGERAQRNVLIAAPATPVSKSLRRRISEIICDVEDICEAHIPNVITLGVNSHSVRVLFLVFCHENRIASIMDSIAPDLESAADNDESFDVWPISRSSELLDSIRKANCVIGWRD